MKRLAWRQRFRRGLSRRLRPVQFWLRRQLLMMVDQLALLIPVHPNPCGVLLVRVDHIGDFVLWLDAAGAIAEHYRHQGKHVTLLGNATWAAWAEQLGIFDEVMPLQAERYKRDLRYRVHITRQLRRMGFSVAVHAASTRVPEIGDALLRLSGASERLGPASTTGIRSSDKWYTRLVPVGTPETGELLKNAAFASEITGRPCRARVADLRGMIKNSALRELAVLLPSEPYFVLFPGASHPGRKWPASRFVELAKKIHERTGWVGVVCGGPGDLADAALLVTGAQPLLRSLAGRTDLGQLATILMGARLLVSNETSAVHIAAAVGAPSLCILGGGHFGRFMPYTVEMMDDRPLPRSAAHPMPCFGCDWTCKFHPRRGQPMPCVEDVSVAAVWHEVESLLPHVQRPSSPFRVLPQHGNPTKDEDKAALVGI